jgi:hypothetical protein
MRFLNFRVWLGPHLLNLRMEYESFKTITNNFNIDATYFNLGTLKGLDMSSICLSRKYSSIFSFPISCFNNRKYVQKSKYFSFIQNCKGEHENN